MSLKAQLADLLEPAPPELDPESIQLGFDTWSSNKDGDLDYSSLGTAKKRDVLNPYGGTKVSRSELAKLKDATSEGDDGQEKYGSSSEDEDSDNENEKGEEDEMQVDDEENWKGFKAGQGQFEGDEKLREDSGSDGSDVPRDDDKDDGIEGTHQQPSELQKALDVKKQLRLWDDILQLRIRYQPLLDATNRISIQTLATDNRDVKTQLHSTMSSLVALESSLFKLRQDMILSNDTITSEDTDKIRSLKRKHPDDENDGESTLLTDILPSTATLNSIYSPMINDTLNKWSSKISVAMSFLQKGQKFTKSDDMDAVQQIEDILRNEGQEIIKRSRRIYDPDQDGVEVEELEDVYEDREWYRRLLREVVEERLGDLDEETVAQMTKKKRKVVDRKASKGRKIRYEPVEKLKGFMIPIPLHRLDESGKLEEWTENQISELFKGLPGRITDDGNTEKEEKEPEADINLNGFKLFG